MSMEGIRGNQALAHLLAVPGLQTVLDVGSGDGAHAQIMRAAGLKVTTVSLAAGADHIVDFMAWDVPAVYDAIWASHVLEHQVDPGAFLRKCRAALRPGGTLAVTVPPLKHSIVGGHVTLWNAGLLLYQLVLAGFDCRSAKVGTYGYNISVLVANEPAALPELSRDAGDVMRLAQFFPMPVGEGFDGRLENIGWGDEPAGAKAPAVSTAPKRVAILGLGPSVRSYLEIIKRAGGREALYDEVWTINALGDVFHSDRVFHMDDIRIQEIRAAARPHSNIAKMVAWLKRHPGPVYTSRSHPDYPGMVDFPLAEVINSTRFAYFNSTAAYAVAYAVHLGVEKLAVYGNDFTYANAHDAEKGRGCVEFWLGMAAARGIKLQIPRDSSLMDACNSQQERVYGYDTLDVTITDSGDRFDVQFQPHDRRPTADEIEARYDHSAHPSPLAE